MDFSRNPMVKLLDIFIENISVYKKQVLLGIGVICIGAIGITSYSYYNNMRRTQAHKAFIEALKYYDGVVSPGKPSHVDNDGAHFATVQEKWEATERIFKENYTLYKSTELAAIFLAFHAEALTHLGKLDDAIKEQMEAVASCANPALKEFYELKGACMMLDSVTYKTQGLELLKKIARTPNSSAHERALYHLGSYFWAQKQFDDAKGYWQQLLVKYGAKDVKHPSSYAQEVKDKLELISVEPL